MAKIIKQINAQRGDTVQQSKRGTLKRNRVQPSFRGSLPCTALEEVRESIHMPTFDMKHSKNAEAVELDEEVVEKVKAYAMSISSMYEDHAFHNFDHASHVTMSVVKLLDSIVTPDLSAVDGQSMASTMHDYTYSITSDPLTQFACVFSALIHDVGHTGVPNSQLCKENVSLSTFYKNQSVAEQNSVDLAWYLLEDELFCALRQAVYQTDEEKKRFRQLVVNQVMATDVMDNDLNQLRNDRWERAFSETADAIEPGDKSTADRKATIVIEHLIQASDVSHTMQHCHIYPSWNQRLFEEMYQAYLDGRAEQDPADNWYEGEIGFFDFYIIPLAKKLKDCGIFGVSSDEYLNYAERNRQEWMEKGRAIVAEMKARVSTTS